MRRLLEKNGLKINAIAGTHVVFFGFDLAEESRLGFRGFGIKRFDPETSETIWLRGMKTFQETEPYPVIGEMFRSCNHPFQSFQWADYSVKPAQQYQYTIVALYGKATDLTAKIEVELDIHTEQETGPMHSVFFNRGSVATQEYARRFENKEPSEAGVGAYQWLSRGLVEALIAFIDRAQAGWELHAAVYEFQWAALFNTAKTTDNDPAFSQFDVLKAIKTAADRGVKIKILYDDIQKYKTNDKTGKKEPSGPWSKNRKAIEAAGIELICAGRSNSSKIMHNKFFVLSESGKPKAVWTGSTNLTENGIFGHSNLGHIVEDETTAQAFLDYWLRLSADPKVDIKYREANTAAAPLPPIDWQNGTMAIFSPRGTSNNLDALDWYAEIAANAKSALFMTFAFGMHDKFKQVYQRDDQILRMALLEKEGNSPKTREQDKNDIQQIRKKTNVVVAIGNRLKTNAFDRWLAEMDRVNPHVHVRWIHTKYMLVDPLSEIPIIVSGSANFSKASTYDNDENMLVIRGDTRIADIYFGEYIRLYAHYAFREAVKWYIDKKKIGKAEEWQPQFLIDDDKWMESYFDPADKSARFARREYFAGKKSG